jgi:hypothetical protein
VQGDRAENTQEELETRRRRAEFLKRLKVVTEEQLVVVREKLTELQKRSNELRVTTMSKVEGKVRQQLPCPRFRCLCRCNSDGLSAGNRIQHALQALARRRSGNTFCAHLAHLHVSLVRVQPPFYDATWEVRFTDSDEAEELAYIACHKRNWPEYWLLLDSVRGCRMDELVLDRGLLHSSVAAS